MITVDIEKEIQQENKIFMGLSARKALSLLVAGILAIVFTLILGLDLSIYPSLLVGVLCFAFGWYKKDGLVFEKYVLKILKEKFYKNSKRKYRTKNKYIMLMNAEYRRHKTIDMSNKKIAKKIKKEAKKATKTVKKSNLKPIQ